MLTGESFPWERRQSRWPPSRARRPHVAASSPAPRSPAAAAGHRRRHRRRAPRRAGSRARRRGGAAADAAAGAAGRDRADLAAVGVLLTVALTACHVAPRGAAARGVLRRRVGRRRRRARGACRDGDDRARARRARDGRPRRDRQPARRRSRRSAHDGRLHRQDRDADPEPTCACGGRARGGRPRAAEVLVPPCWRRRPMLVADEDGVRVAGDPGRRRDPACRARATVSCRGRWPAEASSARCPSTRRAGA